MIEIAIYISMLGLVLGIVAGLFRVAAGPTVLDRVLAFDLITTCAVGIIILLSMIWHTADYVELILIYTLLGFSGATAFVFYLQRAYDPEELESPRPPREEDGKP